jgi:drug/metabolite transporter (DMT)-like permease
MFASFLTAVFFSLSVIFASRSAKIFGAQTANVGRITLALLLLAAWAHGFGGGLRGAGLPWFLASGVIGFGFGDIALFGALPRIGPRLSILITQCLAAPIASFVEWLWLGTRLTSVEVLCAGIILAGVALALAPDRGSKIERRVFWIGVLCGIGSALGQALGAVISRWANHVSELGGVSVDGCTAAYQRVIGGAIMTWIVWFFLRRSESAEREISALASWRKGWPLVTGNALAGPVFGVGCYQWALRTNPSGIVLPIVATSPLVTMALAFWIDGVKPSRRAITGGLVAVAGAVLLNWAKARG